MSHNTLDDLLAAIGYGKVSAHMVANKLAPDRPHIEPIPKKPPQKHGKTVRQRHEDQRHGQYAHPPVQVL